MVRGKDLSRSITRVEYITVYHERFVYRRVSRDKVMNYGPSRDITKGLWLAWDITSNDTSNPGPRRRASGIILFDVMYAWFTQMSCDVVYYAGVKCKLHIEYDRVFYQCFTDVIHVVQKVPNLGFLRTCSLNCRSQLFNFRLFWCVFLMSIWSFI
jgi:hypothetical protein